VQVGMMLGNALNGVTVGVKSLLEALRSESSNIEWALAMGATRFEAVWCDMNEYK
jgi:putative ABC transport system permease protein